MRRSRVGGGGGYGTGGELRLRTGELRGGGYGTGGELGLRTGELRGGGGVRGGRGFEGARQDNEGWGLVGLL
jgi:hypothetical protein